MCIVIIYLPVCGVINFEINLSLFIKPFSLYDLACRNKNLNILRTKRVFDMK